MGVGGALKAAQVLRTEPRKQMTLLIDEVELHLHPQWQRRILPAVLAVERTT